jgi:hypothetical protein
MERPATRLSGPVLDADDAIALAEFYAALLGWELREREGPRPGYPVTDGWARLWSPYGRQKIEVQSEPRYVRPTWPPVEGEQQMMVHLDVVVGDLEAGVAWAKSLGATVAEPQLHDHDFHVVMLDPAGHPFCMCRGEV